MDKKRVGAIVGVVGVAGLVTASYLLKVDPSQADLVTQDLAAQYNASLSKSQASSQEESEVSESEEKQEVSREEASLEAVYDPVQKIEYLVAAPSAKEEKQEEKKEAQDREKAEEESKLEASLETQEEPEEEVAQTETQDIEVEPEEAPTFARSKSEKFIGIVTTDVLNVRSGADMESEVVTVFLKNDVVRGVADGEWVAAEDPTGLIGYVNKAYLAPVSEEEAQAQEEANRLEAEKKAEEERIAAEQKAEEERLAQQKAEAEKEAQAQAEEAKRAQEEEEKRRQEEAQSIAKEEAEEAERLEQAAKEEEETAVEGYIRVDSANVRSQASTTSTILASINANTPIEGTKKGEWIRFDYHGQTGFIAAYLVGPEQIEISASNTPKTYAKQQAEAEAAKPKETAGYVNTTANVRKGPGTNYEIIQTVAINTYVEGAESNGWVKFSLDGQEAYLSAALLNAHEIEEAAPEANESYAGNLSGVLEYATSKVGSAYIYGGEGAGGYDCSGLVMMAYRQAGVRLPHSSRAQYGYGYAVSMENLQAGDLLFYASGDSIDHVAMYIGNGRMVHASTPSTGVRYDSISSPWYQSRFVGARRIFN